MIEDGQDEERLIKSIIALICSIRASQSEECKNWVYVRSQTATNTTQACFL